MSNVLTCKALKLICGEDIRYFELAEVIYLTRMKKLYVCLGRHSIYLLKRNLRKTISGGKLKYSQIEGIYEDTSKDTRFLILFDNEDGKVWIDDKIIINCLNRCMLCNYLEMAWRSDHAFRTGKYYDFPRFGINLSEVGRLVESSKKRNERFKKVKSIMVWRINSGENNAHRFDTSKCVGLLDERTLIAIQNQLKSVEEGYTTTIFPLTKVEEFQDYRRYHFDGYFFFAKQGFENKATQSYSSQTGSYVSYNGVEIDINVHPQIFLNQKKPNTNNTQTRESKEAETKGSSNIGSSLYNVAQEYVRFLSNMYTSQTYSVYLNGQYNKKMNLSDDISTWSCWEIFIKTTRASIACIIMRRCYIPPTLDSYQDISVTYSCSYKDMRYFNITDRDLLRECRLTADSISPISQHHTLYTEFIQSQLDTLLFDEFSYSWISTNIKLHPVFRTGARSFLKSILQMLDKANILADRDLIEEIDLLEKSGTSRYDSENETKVEVFEDPMACIHEMLSQISGIDKFSRNVVERQKLHFFELRLARYLSYCIDGGLLGAKFIIEDLVSSIGMTSRNVDSKIRQVLDYLLHVRSKDMTEDYTQLKLVNLLQDPGFVKEYCFVPSVMARFVNSGYCARLVPAGKEALYVEFLMNLLTLPAKNNFGQRSQLRISILQQVLHATGDSIKRDYYIQMIPLLVEIFSGNEVDDDNTGSKYSGAILLNLCFSNDVLKGELVKAGVSSAIIKKLRKRDDLQLTKICLSLIVNISKDPSHRQVLIADGILPIIADALHESLENFRPLNQELILQRNRGQNQHIVNSTQSSDWDVLPIILGVIGQLSNENDVKNMFVSNWCVLDHMLYLFHNLEVYVGSNNDIICKIIFCIKQLSGSNWIVQLRVGKHCIPTLIEIISTPTNKKERREVSTTKFIQYYSYWVPSQTVSSSSDSSIFLSGINGDVIFHSLLLLETLSHYHPNCIEMVSCGIENALDLCLESYCVDTIVIKLNYLKDIVRKVALANISLQ
ncbi:ARM repeat-containing protein [Cryptosporidium canis]|uniref:ARM repeat-containing protein n=1 Tax=Cryptosporidium canis TaxID=195482 RepID=A0A9D5DIW0_9CRYT|nr:ARM repeat-containing protein [Cryptosporidium canis]